MCLQTSNLALATWFWEHRAPDLCLLVWALRRAHCSIDLAPGQRSWVCTQSTLQGTCTSILVDRCSLNCLSQRKVIVVGSIIAMGYEQKQSYSRRWVAWKIWCNLAFQMWSLSQQIVSWWAPWFSQASRDLTEARWLIGAQCIVVQTLELLPSEDCLGLELESTPEPLQGDQWARSFFLIWNLNEPCRRQRAPGKCRALKEALVDMPG